MFEEELTRAEINRGHSGAESNARDLIRIAIYACHLRNVLRMLEWGGVETMGAGACLGCSRYPQQGHADDCFLAEALKPRDVIVHAQQVLQDAQVCAHRQRHSLAVLTEGIRCCLADMDANLANLSRVLDRV